MDFFELWGAVRLPEFAWPVYYRHRQTLFFQKNNFNEDTWREAQLTDVAARLIIYRAFIESELEVPKHLARTVHEGYFAPQHEDFQPRTLWSLSNAFTSAFKQLEPIPQFRATAKLAGFLERP